MNIPLTEPASFSPHETASSIQPRPVVQGKFFFVGEEKLFVRGVTYGTFRPDDEGHEYPRAEVVEQDFAAMAANGINAVRVYTPPPHWLLDAALRHGLYLMIGLSLERFIGYLTDTDKAPDIEGNLRKIVRQMNGHPAILCFAVANEIPASSVRWLGRKRVESFLRRMCAAVKEEDPGALVTYVNYPSTEYLQLHFLDFLGYNVYLEDRGSFDKYLAHLHTLSDDRPVVLSEIGLDSYRHGETKQAEVLSWQVHAAFAAECAGTFVYAWTDEWHRGGEDVFDWEFGLTRRDRSPKPALLSLRQTYQETPFAAAETWPRISVVVCSFNGRRTIRDTFEGLRRLDYPNYEVILVDDGSTDGTGDIASGYDVQVIQTPNGGLSRARNLGLEAATGEIVAYIDDDAYPDPDWLHYLAARLAQGNWVAVGGPNLAPAGDGPVAACIANAPGGPLQVLISDREAEHIPGCNMAFRRDALLAIGGFDPQFRVAGDDVDVCWRLMEAGGRIGFSPCAVVWHHRRNSVKAFWRQQHGYGRAEALLEQKWPSRYNVLGHATWSGRVYGAGVVPFIGLKWRVYHGQWGSAPFQSLHESPPTMMQGVLHMPEWWLIIAALTFVSAAGFAWPMLFLAAPLAVLALSFPILHAFRGARRARFDHPEASVAWLRMLTFGLFLLQPIARLSGRIHFGLNPWRLRAKAGWSLPLRVRTATWRREWRSPEDRIHRIWEELRNRRVFTLIGGDFDDWELEVRGGLLGSARLRAGVEELGGGCQMVRFQTSPRFSKIGLALVAVLLGLAALAFREDGVVGSLILGVSGVLLLGRVLLESGVAVAALKHASAAGGQ